MTARSPVRSRPRVAAIYTELRFRSHAYNILENFLGPYLFRGKLVDPGVDVVSLYADQFPTGDLSREVSRRFKIPLHDSIEDAVCCGGKQLAVDGVLLIGEHGTYPYNAKGQHLYPRKQFFDRIVGVMQRSKRFVPIFNDKHLSYRWDWARQMYDTAVKHKIPFMAGSSVPLAQRIPSWELPMESPMREAVSIHGGSLESYGFHGLEVLQSFAEFRRGGESGVSQVEVLVGEDFRQARRDGRWSQQLERAAMAAESASRVRRQAWPLPRPLPAANAKVDANAQRLRVGEHAIIVTYADGFQGTVLKLGSDSNRWNFACRLSGKDSTIRATSLFNGPWGNRCLFKALSHAIQHLFIHRQTPYPIQRTLLTTGLVAAAVDALPVDGPLKTPQLTIAYRPKDFQSFREDGSSWEKLTVDTRQPVGFEPRSFDSITRD